MDPMAAGIGSPLYSSTASVQILERVIWMLAQAQMQRLKTGHLGKKGYAIVIRLQEVINNVSENNKMCLHISYSLHFKPD